MTTKLLTTTLSTGETVLAKMETVTNPDAIIPQGNRQPVPLRYGNETQAKKKLDTIRSLLLPARYAGIAKQGGKFLILIYDKPSYQTFSHNDISRMMVSQTLASMSPSIRRRFATVTGQRQNPRNRHNHNHKDQTDKPYYFGE